MTLSTALEARVCSSRRGFPIGLAALVVVASVGCAVARVRLDGPRLDGTRLTIGVLLLVTSGSLTLARALFEHLRHPSQRPADRMAPSLGETVRGQIRDGHDPLLTRDIEKQSAPHGGNGKGFYG